MFDDVENENLELENQQDQQLIEEQHESEQENKPQESFRELRNKLQRAQKERDEAYNYIKNIQAKNDPAPVNNNNVDEDFNLDPDALAEGKHLNKLKNEIKQVQKQLQEFRKVSDETIAENKLRAKYADFDQVLTKENIVALQENNPDLWNAVKSSPDIYNQGVSAYMFIKSLNLPAKNLYDEDKAIMQKNMGKPRSMTSVAPQRGNSPLSQANVFEKGLTPELAKSLYAEMRKATGDI